MKITFDVKNQILSRTDRQLVVASSTEYLEAEITFSEDWDGLEKTMQFVNGDTIISMVINDTEQSHKISPTQHLNLGVGTWKVSIIGVSGDKRIVTNAANLAVWASGWIGVLGPVPSVYEQLLVIIQSLHTEAASTAVIRSAVQQYIVDNYDALVKDVIIVDDVKEIIDDMVDDGTISALLDPIVARETAGQAAEWLEENVDPDTGYVIDKSLTIENAAADAEATGNALADKQRSIDVLKDVVTVDTPIDWSLAATETYLTGWENGYYNNETGETKSSNYYIRTENETYFSDENATAMEVFAPSGYRVGVYEYEADGTYVGQHGSITTPETGSHVFFVYDKGHKFRFAIGRFDDEADANSHRTDENFIASCVAKFYTVTAEDEITEIEDQISNINKNLDTIFYTEDLEYEGDDWQVGYWRSDNGTYKSSNHYICTKSAVIISKSNATRLQLTAPDGYGIRAFEYDSNGTFVKAHGNYQFTPTLDIAYTAGHYFRLAIGRFDNNDAYDYLTDEFIAQVGVTICETKIMASNNKKEKTGDFEWFSVTVDRPLAFGGEEVNDDEYTVECVLRLPNTYTREGTPTRLVLACHGASGYIQQSTSTWYNSDWKSFMDSLLAAGYAVFDANVLPTSYGTSVMGRAVGSPLYVNVLKKAYDYIVQNYNVTDKILAHGTSMGGVGAEAFANAYPGIVLAVSSFAGRDLLLYVERLYTGAYTDDDFATAWGYDSMADLVADKWSHVFGAGQSLSLLKYTNGVMNYPPSRETNYNDWMAYYADVYSHGKDDPIGQYTAHRNTPYKTWDSWADDIGCAKAKLILKEAFSRGSSVPYEVVIYEDATHNELSYGKGDYIGMRDQLIAWFRRWE